MPAQQLKGGKTATKFAPRGGEIETATAVSVDLDGDGGHEIIAKFRCSAGGVSWPQLLLVYSHGPVLRGSVDLGKRSDQEHSDVDHWATSGAAVALTWLSYEGAGFDVQHHTSRLAMSGGRVTFVDTKPVVIESVQAEALVKRFLDAAVARDTRTMKSLASTAAYSTFAGYGPNWSDPGPCHFGRALADGCETVIVSGGVGLIFTFGVERASDGAMRISTITFGGDAG